MENSCNGINCPLKLMCAKFVDRGEGNKKPAPFDHDKHRCDLFVKLKPKNYGKGLQISK